jgi:type IV secretory pathway VirB10-like protein
MEDFKIILYIFGIVVYIIYMAMRKYFNPEEDRPAEHLPPVPPDRPRSAGRPVEEGQPSQREFRPVPREFSPGPPAAPAPTPFEEMMRRMQKPAERKAEQEPGEMAEKAQERAQEKAEEIRSKAAQARDQVKQRVTDYQRLESRPIINYESTPSWRKALDEETTPRVKTALSIRKKPVHPYAAMLQNPKDARAAFVLTQILERKEW